ncbi:MAG TPA: DUF1648 domain-containing protein [Planctomycetota bacterium]
MRKVPLILTLALAAGTGAYLLWAFPRLPATVPMKWDMANKPVAFGSREAFVGIPAVITVLFAVLFPAATWWQPKAAWLGPVALGTLLFIVHVSIQAVLNVFLPVPVNVGVLVAILAVVTSSSLLAFASVKAARARHA